MTCGFERNTSPTHTELYYCCALESTSCLSGNTELADDDILPFREILMAGTSYQDKMVFQTDTSYDHLLSN